MIDVKHIHSTLSHTSDVTSRRPRAAVRLSDSETCDDSTCTVASTDNVSKFQLMRGIDLSLSDSVVGVSGSRARQARAREPLAVQN